MIEVSELTIEQAKYLIGQGVEVYMPVMIEAPATILDEQVYAGLPYRTFIDDYGEEQVYTFKDWGGPGHQPFLTSNDGQRVILCSILFYEFIKGSEWIIFDGMPGITLYDYPSFDILKQTAAWQGQ